MPNTVRLEPFKPEHLAVVPWGEQAWLEPFAVLEEANGFAASVFSGDDFLGAGGVQEVVPVQEPMNEISAQANDVKRNAIRSLMLVGLPELSIRLQ